MSVAPFEWYPLTEGKNHTPSAAEWGIDRARGLLGGETQKERQLTELTPGATKPLLNRGSYAHAAVIKSDVFVSGDAPARAGAFAYPGVNGAGIHPPSLSIVGSRSTEVSRVFFRLGGWE